MADEKKDEGTATAAPAKAAADKPAEAAKPEAKPKAKAKPKAEPVARAGGYVDNGDGNGWVLEEEG